MSSADGCEFDPGELSDEEKDDLLLEMHGTIHELIDANQEYQEIETAYLLLLTEVDNGLAAGNRFGKRKRTIQAARIRLTTFATVRMLTRVFGGIEPQKADPVDEAFEDIISRMDDEQGGA